MTRRVLLPMCLVLAVLASPAFAQGTADGSSASLVQRGDVAVGYSFMRDEGFSLPMGISLSDGWRVAPRVDLVGQVQYNHGTVLDTVGLNIWAAMAGIRGNGGSRYGTGVSAFGQILAGVVGVSASVGTVSESTGAFGIQPSFGVDVPVHPKVAIRPECGLLVAFKDGDVLSDNRFGVSVVFRLFRH